MNNEMLYKHYDFVEIGTSDFDTLIENSSEETIGISVEPIKYYLDRLPDKNNVTKLRAALSTEDGECNVYYISDDKINEHSLQWWVRGSNSINNPHPIVLNDIGEDLYYRIVTIEKVPTVSWKTLIETYLIGSIGHLKIDTEGHDHIILRDFLIYCDQKSFILPDKITLEYFDGISDKNEIDKLVLGLSNYNITRTNIDMVLTKKQENKSFWTLTPEGKEVLRDLETENKNFTREAYLKGEFDGNNYMWFEMFSHHSFDDNGCDYERYGCYIKEGDVVLDLGANIGLFAHRAETRGASKVICFEPVTPTFNCLIKNKGPKTLVYKNAVGGEQGFTTFNIHTDFTHIGGGTSHEQDLMLEGRNIVHSERAIIIGINEIFDGMDSKIDFMKIDIEGGEVDVLTAITDENLSSLRCLSAEFHKTYDGFDSFQSNFTDRMYSLGFTHFIVYYGNGDLRTLTFWKK
jgi:FkbM family methyltransferase